MDRYLLTGAISLLFLEIFILAADMQWIPVNLFAHRQENALQIGHVDKTKELVRKKSQNSIIWEDSVATDQLYAYDSLLTLDNSFAKISLSNDIQVHLHENTLVVLEPPLETKGNKNIRLTFNQGNMRTKTQSPFRLGAKNWTLQALPGTDLSLRSLEGDQIEVEVTTGNIELVNKTTQKMQTVEKGNRLTLSKRVVEKAEVISQELKWKHPKNFRVYSHYFPTNINLAWEGEAETIRFTDKNKNTSTTKVKGIHQYFTMLPAGTYVFQLENQGQTSENLFLHIFPAPKVKYFSPLPRDRISLDQKTYFSWSANKDVKKYKIEFGLQKGFLAPSYFLQSPENHVNVSLPKEGKFFWRVLMFDDLGFKIPAFYSFPIYSVSNPFAPPQLKKPKITPLRGPAQEKQDLKNREEVKEEKAPLPKGALHLPRKKFHKISRIFKWFLPLAHAQEKSPTKIREVLFEWEDIPGADYYIIEVSKRPDFQKLEINQRVYDTQFFWKENYTQDIYYIRVAAGDVNGRMGLFSPPQAVNLNEVTVQVGEEQPPALPVVQEPKPTPLAQKPPPLYPKHIGYIKKPKPPQLQGEKLEVKAPKTFAEVSPLQLIPLYYFRFWLETTYQLGTYEKDKDFEVSHDNMTPFSFGINGLYKNYMYDFRSQFVEWDKVDRLSFQKDLDFWQASAGFYYSKNKTWFWGLHSHLTSLPKRKSYEEIVIEDQFFVGPGLIYFKPWTDWQLRVLAAIDYNHQAWLLNIDPEISYNFRMKNLFFFMGGRFNMYGFSGDDFSGFKLEPGLFLGIEW